MTENAKPIIAWYNRVLDATITVSTEDAAYPKENLYDLRPDTFHKGTGSSEQQITFTFGSVQKLNDFFAGKTVLPGIKGLGKPGLVAKAVQLLLSLKLMMPNARPLAME